MNAQEVLPTTREIETFRTPLEYVAWFDKCLERTRGIPAPLHGMALRHLGDFKPFYEELFPLAKLLGHKIEAWKESKFCNLLGRDSFDVEVRSDRLPFKWIEITSSFDADEAYRMKLLADNGEVSGGEVLRNDVGERIGISREMRTLREVVLETCQTAADRIATKSARSYSGNPALLVYIDDYKTHDDRIYVAVDEVCRSMKDRWCKVFSQLFVVGPRNAQCVELSA